MTTEQIDFVKRAFRMLASELNEDEMLSAGIGICSGIVGAKTNDETGRNVSEHLLAYLHGIIDSYRKETENGGQNL